MEELYLALGSNLGDREQNIATAISKLNEVFGAALVQSSVVRTQACGFDGPDFYNTVAKFLCRKEPIEVLQLCKSIEREMGREDEIEFNNEGERVYHNRIIDIDILKYGQYESKTDILTLPHPQIKTRPYILPLLMEIEGK